MNIVLTGFTGTGKTVVGRILAERLGRKFIDINEIIEEREKDKISRIPQIKGEGYLKKIEKKIVEEISDQDNCIIATGSNTILSDENYRNLKKNGIIICLTAEPSITILRATPTKDSSVLLKSKDAIQTIRKVMKEREPYYSKAGHTIDTSDSTPEEVAEKIIQLVRSS